MADCRSCGAELESATCRYCGTPVEPEAVRSAPEGALACPRCPGTTGLRPHGVDGARVDGCPSCGGLWVPAATLEPLVEAGARRLPAGEGGAAPRPVTGPVEYLRCPACSQQMARRNYARVSGIIVDACHAHGVWLDAGELQAMRLFVAGGGRSRQAEAEADKRRVAEELADLRRSGRPGQGSVLGDLGAGYGPWGSGIF